MRNILFTDDVYSTLLQNFFERMLKMTICVSSANIIKEEKIFFPEIICTDVIYDFNQNLIRNWNSADFSVVYVSFFVVISTKSCTFQKAVNDKHAFI